MESTDIIGRIQVPQNVFERLRHNFVLEERGEIEVKGKGMMRTWFLVGRKPVAETQPESGPYGQQRAALIRP
jgi:adenylate cyclase